MLKIRKISTPGSAAKVIILNSRNDWDRIYFNIGIMMFFSNPRNILLQLNNDKLFF